MNTRERVLVNRLVTRLAEASEAPQDSDAELEVKALLRIRPDAPYLLLQRVLMLEEALEQAHLKLDRVQTNPAGGVVPSAAAPLAPASVASTPTQGVASATGSGGFLRNAATIGAGVLGGSLLFQGIESLLHASRGPNGGAAQAPVAGFETNNFIQPLGGDERPDALADTDSGQLLDGTALDVGLDSWT